MATEYISKAWKVYKKNALSFIAAELIPNLIAGLLIFLGFAVFFSQLLPWIDLDTIANISDEKIMGEFITELVGNKEFLTQLANGAVGFGGFFLIAVLVSTYFGIGQVGMACESLKRKTKIRTMFRVSRKLGFRWIGTSLLLLVFALIAFVPMFVIISILTFIGFGTVALAFISFLILGFGIISVILIVPVISLISPAMVIEDSSPIQSIKNAFNSAKKNYLQLFALLLIYVVGSVSISFLGEFLSYVPLIGDLINMSISLFITFAIVPMMKVSFAGYYLENRKGSMKGI